MATSPIEDGSVLKPFHHPDQEKKFSLNDALGRLLAGESPVVIFGVPLLPFLTREDLDRNYGKQEDPDNPHDPRKKNMVNTLRAAACTTVNAEITKYPFPTLTMNHVTADAAKLYGEWTVQAFSRISFATIKLVQKPDPQSNFERILEIMRPYYDLPDNTAINTAREMVAQRVTSERLLKTLAPLYHNLLHSIYQRDHNNFPDIPDDDPTMDIYTQLVFNSLGIFFTSARKDIGHQLAVAGVITHGHVFNSDIFELAKLPTGEYFVRIKPADQTKARRIAHSYSLDPEYNTKPTGCPALTTVEDDSYNTPPDVSLIQSVFELAVGKK